MQSRWNITKRLTRAVFLIKVLPESDESSSLWSESESLGCRKVEIRVRFRYLLFLDANASCLSIATRDSLVLTGVSFLRRDEKCTRSVVQCQTASLIR